MVKVQLKKGLLGYSGVFKKKYNGKSKIKKGLLGYSGVFLKKNLEK